MKAPFFSIIIPTYNRKDFLKIALNSVLNQTFSDYEIIVVDDGSTDHTKKLITSTKNEKITYLHQKNQGPAAARNKGIKKAQGKFVCFLDSDDRFCKEKLETTYQYIKRYPEYKILHTEEIWYRCGRLLSEKKHHRKPTGPVFNQAVKLCCISPSTVAIKRKLFEKIGYFDQKLPACEDYDLFLRITAQYPVLLIPKALTIKQGGHSDQQSKKYPAMDSFRIYALDKLLSSNTLNNQNYNSASEELTRKCTIYLKGALKRGRTKEAAFCKRLLNKYNLKNPTFDNVTIQNKNLKSLIKNTFGFQPNRNQLTIISRLLFEISRRENLALSTIARQLKANPQIQKASGKNKFSALKKALIARRFRLSLKHQAIDTKQLFLNPLPKALKDNWQPQKVFKPLKLFVEKSLKNSSLVKNITSKFPKIEIEEVNQSSDYLKTNKFNLADLKKPYLFVAEEKWDFLKPCPCTKYHLNCGYWIFNLGFGCPFDCSYCFLQQYSNFPGITLPGNLDDFFEQFDTFSKKLKKPIRIGTGEFSDSLALDEITGYSKKLIPYFKNKPVSFELKTKSDKVNNLLNLKASPNIVISWSLNPPNLINSEEIGVANLNQRLKAAKKVSQVGYSLGFHFDPIIYSSNWEEKYHQLIKTLYSHLKPPFAWISLGTLRSNRRLKTASELRFPKSDIFYGELLIDKDKKLRYTEFLRAEIYKKMNNWIRNYDQKTPVYLCMESKLVWKSIGKFNSSKRVEKYLNPCP